MRKEISIERKFGLSLLSCRESIRVGMLPICVILILASSDARAASILGDSFQLDGHLDSDTIGPVMTTASTASLSVLTNPDVIFQWVDEDSFDVVIEGLSSDFDFELSLSDLQFQTPSGQVVDISGANFNFNDSDYGSYLFDPIDNPTGAPRPSDPVVSWTTDSVTVGYGSDWSGQLAADWPTLRFDVVALPEPSSLLTVVLSILALVGVYRRH